jgi:UDP-N-acetyl-D-mannosaminuronic acid dehydrogenase
MTDIAVWGLGKMGLPLACIFADKGFPVTGIDIDEKRILQVNAGINPLPEEPGLNELLKSVLEKNFKAVTTPVKADIHIIIVPILLQDKKADLSILEDVLRKIAGVLNKGNIVVLESTAPPGTCENFMKPLLEATGLKTGVDFGIAHCPERTMTGTALKDITYKYPKVIGASDVKTATIIKELYQKINKKGVIMVKDTKTAEAVKVVEGIYRDVNIALANELALYCEGAGIDVLEVIEAANTQPYSHVHKPGAGVGGHCIPVYPYYIMSEKTNLIRTARHINEYMPYHVVDLAEEMFKRRGIDFEGVKVALLGISFRSGVKEDRYSPFFSVRDELIRRKVIVYGYDPLYTKEEVESYGVVYAYDFTGIDGIIILTDHDEFCQLDWDQLFVHGVRIVVDGRNILDSEQMKLKGFDYVGVGRMSP